MKINKIICLTLCVGILLPNIVIPAFADSSKIKNIIYMIPDGGGMVPFELANEVKKAGGFNDGIYPNATKTEPGEMNLSEYLVGAETTYCSDAAVTDSAAAGTALSTGYKTNTGAIGIDAEGLPKATILEICQDLGKKTGMVTTYDWTNATPAAFSAHNVSRSNGGMLAEQIANQNIDVVLGVGYEGLGWGDITESEKRGYKIINNRDDINNIKQGDRIWGNLEIKEFPYDINNKADTVNLADMTKAAITALSNDENGFFLMVEGSRVDGGGHANDVQGMVGDFLAFDAAVGVALDYAKDRNDTIVVVCPDHDTGGMNLPEDAEVLKEVVKAVQNGEEPESVTWTTTSHTNRNGGVFMYVPDGIEYPQGIDKDAENPYETNVIDNTEIMQYLTNLIGTDRDAVTQKLFVDITEKGKYDSSLGLFVFDGTDVSVKKNTSYAFVGDRIVDLDGEVAFEINGQFYVPQKLLDIMDGKEAPDNTVGKPVVPRVDCFLNEDGTANVSMNIRNLFVKKDLSGYIEFASPENAKQLGKIPFGTLGGLQEKNVKIDCNEVNKNGCDFTYNIVLDSGEIYSFNEKYYGSFYASYTDKPITIDGIIDEEWANAHIVVLDDPTLLKDEENWKGSRDLSATLAVMFDEENLYFYTTVTDEIFCQNATETDLWNGDSTQLCIYNDCNDWYKNKVAGVVYEGLNFGLLNGKAVAHRSKRGMRLTPTGVLDKEKIDYDLQITQNLIDTTYEFRISWEDLFGYAYAPKTGDMFAFAYLANDNDGNLRRGAIMYGDGVYGSKDVNQFVPMYLADETGKLNSQNIEVKLYNGDKLFDSALKPFNYKSSVFVETKGFLDNLGVSYTVDGSGTVIPDGTNLELANKNTVGDSEITSTMRDEILYSPLRALCENLGKTVEWNDEQKTVYIKN